MEIDYTSVGIIGAGNGGLAFGAYCKRMGFDVKIWNRSKSRLDSIRKNNGVTVDGIIQGHYKIEPIYSLKEILQKSSLIMIVTSGDAHRELATRMAPYLHEEQIIILNPGRTGGALEFSHFVRQSNVPSSIKIAEAQSLLFVARSYEPAHVTITGIKNELPVASFPSKYNDEVLSVLREIHKSFVPSETVLETSINNMGAMFHPAPLLLNVARCEDSNVIYNHYIDGISPSVARFVEQLDQERLKIAEAFDIETLSLKQWLRKVYGSKGTDLYQTIRNTKQYKNVVAPSTLQCRYIYEDIPTGLVPLISLGEIIGVNTQNMETTVNLANSLLQTNFYKIGRNTESMGLTGIPLYLLKDYLIYGDEIIQESRYSVEMMD